MFIMISFASAVIDLYLQYMNIKASEVCKMTKNVFGEYRYSSRITFPLLFFMQCFRKNKMLIISSEPLKGKGKIIPVLFN
jgi:hypothetical protein